MPPPFPELDFSGERFIGFIVEDIEETQQGERYSCSVHFLFLFAYDSHEMLIFS
jgi:hypothetical protein